MLQECKLEPQKQPVFGTNVFSDCSLEEIRAFCIKEEGHEGPPKPNGGINTGGNDQTRDREDKNPKIHGGEDNGFKNQNITQECLVVFNERKAKNDQDLVGKCERLGKASFLGPCTPREAATLCEMLPEVRCSKAIQATFKEDQIPAACGGAQTGNFSGNEQIKKNCGDDGVRAWCSRKSKDGNDNNGEGGDKSDVHKEIEISSECRREIQSQYQNETEIAKFCEGQTSDARSGRLNVCKFEETLSFCVEKGHGRQFKHQGPKTEEDEEQQLPKQDNNQIKGGNDRETPKQQDDQTNDQRNKKDKDRTNGGNDQETPKQENDQINNGQARTNGGNDRETPKQQDDQTNNDQGKPKKDNDQTNGGDHQGKPMPDGAMLDKPKVPQEPKAFVPEDRGQETKEICIRSDLEARGSSYLSSANCSSRSNVSMAMVIPFNGKVQAKVDLQYCGPKDNGATFSVLERWGVTVKGMAIEERPVKGGVDATSQILVESGEGRVWMTVKAGVIISTSPAQDEDARKHPGVIVKCPGGLNNCKLEPYQGSACYGVAVIEAGEDGKTRAAYEPCAGDGQCNCRKTCFNRQCHVQQYSSGKAPDAVPGNEIPVNWPAVQLALASGSQQPGNDSHTVLAQLRVMYGPVLERISHDSQDAEAKSSARPGPVNGTQVEEPGTTADVEGEVCVKHEGDCEAEISKQPVQGKLTPAADGTQVPPQGRHGRKTTLEVTNTGGQNPPKAGSQPGEGIELQGAPQGLPKDRNAEAMPKASNGRQPGVNGQQPSVQGKGQDSGQPVTSLRNGPQSADPVPKASNNGQQPSGQGSAQPIASLRNETRSAGSMPKAPSNRQMRMGSDRVVTAGSGRVVVAANLLAVVAAMALLL